MTATPEQTWWGMVEDRTKLDQLIGIISRALFHDFGDDGPRFLWAESHPLLDNDQLLGCASDQVAFRLLDHADLVIELIGKIRAQAGAA